VRPAAIVLMALGGVAGGVGGLVLGTYISFTQQGDGQAVFGGLCCGAPIGAPLGAFIGWAIANGLGKPPSK